MRGDLHVEGVDHLLTLATPAADMLIQGSLADFISTQQYLRAYQHLDSNDGLRFRGSELFNDGIYGASCDKIFISLFLILYTLSW